MQKDSEKREYEISDPTSLAKLSGVQLSISSLEQMAVELTTALPEKRGVVHACNVVAQRVIDVCAGVNNEVQAERMTPEEARIRNDQTIKIAAIIREIGKQNDHDLVAMQNKAVGYVEAANAISKKFEAMALKYEKDERVAKEDEEDEREEKIEAPKGKKKVPKKKPKKTGNVKAKKEKKADGKDS